MSKMRANSSPNLLPPAATSNDLVFEGITANIKLLLKIVQDHSDASAKGGDDRRGARVAGMMSILDDVKARIQSAQSFGKRREAELRRCNTDLRPREAAPRGKKASSDAAEPVERLQKELNASTVARKSVEAMCASLGKEKGIMAAELARKAQEQAGMEELIGDLRAQNETLTAKVKKTCTAEHVAGVGAAAVQERTQALSEQLLKSLEGCRLLKRRLREAQEENAALREAMGEKAGRIRSLLRGNTSGEKMEEGMAALEQTFEWLEVEAFKNRRHGGDQCLGEASGGHKNQEK